MGKDLFRRNNGLNGLHSILKRRCLMSITEIGCCGAYCGTCPALIQHTCKGCKIGYDNHERDLSKAKCAIKVCCIGHHFQSCADCSKYESCLTLNEFYLKNGYKYQRYKMATEYIRNQGYEAFLKLADNWKGPYGKY